MPLVQKSTALHAANPLTHCHPSKLTSRVTFLNEGVKCALEQELQRFTDQLR